MKNLKLCQVRPGERFTLDVVEFVKLCEDRGVAFVVTADVILEEVPFDSERETERNNFVGSGIEAAMLEWLDGHPGIEEAVVERPIDLTSMDGMTDYGKPLVTVRLLTIDEYRRYRSLIPLASEPYWTATPWTTEGSPFSDSYSAYYVHTDGTLYYTTASTTRASRRAPPCISNLISMYLRKAVKGREPWRITLNWSS